MDRITKSYVTEFQKKYNFDTDIIPSELFEHFVNYVIAYYKIDDSFDRDLIEKICIGKNGTIGVDGFAIIINGHLITEIEDVNVILDSNKQSKADILFIQSKTSPEFNIKDIGVFGSTVEDFISEDQKYKWTETAIKSIDLFNHLISRVSDLSEKPVCYLYYATLGYLNSEDVNLNAQKEKIITNISAQNIFSNTEFKYIDYSTLQNDYKKIGQSIVKSFDFEHRILIPDINNVTESYIGVVPTTTIVDLMTDEDGQILSTIFYDNVRDFQGDNNINIEIEETLKNDEIKDAFSILNNGITIVAESLVPSRNNFTITNYQFINGLQTSHILFRNKELLTENVLVPLKLIITKSEPLISKIIRSTNRQTAVKDEDLIAYSDFQKKLEDFYKTFPEPDKLYYERRSKQFNKTQVERKRIIDKSTQIKTIGSMIYHKPNMATRFFGALFNDFGSNLFKDNHKMLPYYTTAFTLYKLEELFKSGFVDKKYKKIKFFILMMIGLEINKFGFPKFESKQVEKHCEEFLGKIKDEKSFKSIIHSIIGKIDSLELDLTDLELSKSKKLVDDCKAFYFPRD
ncbi:MAG TPA: AIPR family protein [Pyrinomonadaceae bacterium]|nr:AIPR family protein [Pyrinomonadaceae bacterium]